VPLPYPIPKLYPLALWIPVSLQAGICVTGLLLAGLGAAARQPVAMHHLTAAISYALLWAIYMFHAGRMRRKGLPASAFVVGSAAAYVVVAAVPLAGNGNREWCVRPPWSGRMQVAHSSCSLVTGAGIALVLAPKSRPNWLASCPVPYSNVLQVPGHGRGGCGLLCRVCRGACPGDGVRGHPRVAEAEASRAARRLSPIGA
jgi:hypothetical protein